MSKTSLFLVLIGSVFLATTPAVACQCREMPSAEIGISSHSLIFVGQVVGGRLLGDDPDRGAPYGREFYFKPIEILKGNSTLSKITVFTGVGAGDCGFDFIVGVKYLVYAAGNAKGNFSTGICSPTEKFRANNPGRILQIKKWIVEQKNKK